MFPFRADALYNHYPFMNDSIKATVQPLFRQKLPGIVHGAVSRNGGVSPQPFDTTNISYGVGDDYHNVMANRTMIKKHFGLQYLISARQVHGDHVQRVMPVKEDYVVEDADGLITDVKSVGLMIGHADCQAILLYDTVQRAVGAVHSGWRGSVANIIATTIAAMEEQFNTDPGDLYVAIGPSLGPCCAEFVNYRQELPREFLSFQVTENHFDFWEISKAQLRQCGVSDGKVSCVKICTFCSPDYFSYRRACRDEAGITGRNGTLIALV